MSEKQDKEDFLTALTDPIEYKMVMGMRDIADYYGRLNIITGHQYFPVKPEGDQKTWRILYNVDFPGELVPQHLRMDIIHYFKRQDPGFTVTCPKPDGKDRVMTVFINWNPGKAHPQLLGFKGGQLIDKAIIYAPYMPNK